MLNFEKIRLMAALSIYEDKETQKDMVVHSFFKSDYIDYNLLKSWLYSTIAYVLIGALYVVYNMETILIEWTSYDLPILAKKIGIIYLIVVGLHMTVTYLVYKKRYNEAQTYSKSYQSALKRLNRNYDLADKSKDIKKEDTPK
jgi:hypothetical protein